MTGARYIGHARIERWSDREFIGVQVQWAIAGVEQNGREIGLAAEVGGNGFTGPSRFVLVVEGQRIRGMRITAHGVFRREPWFFFAPEPCPPA